MNNFQKKIALILLSAASLFSACTSVIPDISIAQEEDNHISFELPSVCDNLTQNRASVLKTSTHFPESFDLRDSGLISSVKNQYPYGTCWTYSSASCAETDLIKYNPSIDLSELHTAYYSWSGGEQLESVVTDDGNYSLLNNGGSAGIVTNLWSQWLGPTFEKNVPSKDYDFIYNEKSIEKSKNLSDYHLENAYFIDYDTDVTKDVISASIKTYLLNGQSVEASLPSDSSYLASDKVSFYSGINVTPNHSVTIVGWDDNYSTNHFKGTAIPQHNGAWLIKNSWGSLSGDCGFFWVSYDEPSLSDFTVYEFGSKDNYDTNYHHDTFPPAQYMSASEKGANTSYIANIFTAEKNQYIEAVSTYFTIPDIDYEINVYKNIKNEEYLSNGKPYSTQKGTADKAGYITIPLDTPVNVSKGQKFAVTMKLHSKDTEYIIPLESCTAFVNKKTGESIEISGFIKYNQLKETTSANQSFYSYDGQKWHDTISDNYVYSDSEVNTLIDLVEETYGFEKANEYIQYAKNSDLTVAIGNISLKVFASDENKVKFSHNEENIPLNEAVSLSSSSGKDIYYSVNSGSLKKYVSPISITSPATISATIEQKNFFTKSFIPAKAELNSLSCTIDSKEYEAKRIDSSNYRIFINKGSSATLYFSASSQGEVTFNGNKLKNYAYNYNLPVKVNSIMSTFKMNIQQENRLDNQVYVTVFLTSKTPYYGDVDGNSTIDASDASTMLRIYSLESTNSPVNVSNDEYKRADFNQDGTIDASDASDALFFYAVMSTTS